MIKMHYDEQGIHIDLDFYAANRLAYVSIASGRAGCEKVLEEAPEMFKSEYRLYLDELNEFIQKMQDVIDDYCNRDNKEV